MADDLHLFREAVKDAKPLAKAVKEKRVLQRATPPRPIPRMLIADEQQALVDSLSDDFIPAEEMESGEELLYLRDGHAPDILKKLRRGHWVTQQVLDLHGLLVEEARTYTAQFLHECKKRGVRCVRIIHGKGLGSKNRQPILKNKLRGWLIQRDEVIAFCQAKQVDGGGGAVVVLLKAS